MNAEHDPSELPRLPAPIAAETSAAAVKASAPDPIHDLDGWLEASLTDLEARFESFVTADSLRRSARGVRSRRSAR